MSLSLSPFYSGKVRDLYHVGEEMILMVASDRLSAYDVVMAEPIPQKGRVLTALTDFWLESFPDVASARVSCEPRLIESHLPGFLEAGELHGRSMLVRRAQMLPLECIVRARLAGQAYEEYRQRGTIHAMPAPAGLRLADALPEPIFTPSTKAESGHDQNIDLIAAAGIIGASRLEAVMGICLSLFVRASERMAAVGPVLADTKFELGLLEGELVVCDEVITPDSSRIWPAEAIVPGETPPAFDKQPFRDWLDALGWDRTPPPPPVPAEVVAATSARYVAAYERVSGRSLADWYGA